MIIIVVWKTDKFLLVLFSVSLTILFLFTFQADGLSLDVGISTYNLPVESLSDEVSLDSGWNWEFFPIPHLFCNMGFKLPILPGGRFRLGVGFLNSNLVNSLSGSDIGLFPQVDVDYHSEYLQASVLETVNFIFMEFYGGAGLSYYQGGLEVREVQKKFGWGTTAFRLSGGARAGLPFLKVFGEAFWGSPFSKWGLLEDMNYRDLGVQCGIRLSF